MIDLKHYMLSAILWMLMVGCAGCGGKVSSSNIGGTSPDTKPPTISLTNPADGTTGFAVNSAITITFSEAMDASSINTSTFTLSNGAAGAVTYDVVNMIATFTPSSSLAFSTAYAATITTGVKDAAGNAMASNYTWTFTTGSAPGTATLTWDAPTENADGTTLVDLAGYRIYYGTFSGSYTIPIDAGNVTTYTFTGLSTGTYYFAVTAYDTSGNEGAYSIEVNRSIP